MKKLMDKWRHIKLPSGHLLDKDRECLLKYSTGIDLVINLGTLKGLSPALMSLVAQRVITFDNWVYNVEEQAKINLASFPNVEMITRDSKAGPPKELDTGDIGLIFIDADHSYEETADTFYAWFKYLKIGSIIIFHDYTYLYPNVCKIVDEIKSRNDINYIEKIGACAVLERIS